MSCSYGGSRMMGAILHPPRGGRRPGSRPIAHSERKKHRGEQVPVRLKPDATYGLAQDVGSPRSDGRTFRVPGALVPSGPLVEPGEVRSTQRLLEMLPVQQLDADIQQIEIVGTLRDERRELR